MTDDRTEGRPAEPQRAGSPSEQTLAASIQDVVIRQATDAIVVTDATSRILVWNPAAERLYRIPADEAFGRALPDLIESIDEAGQPIDRLVVRAALEADGVWRQRIHHRLNVGPLTGRRLVVDIAVSLLRDPDGTTLGSMSVLRDVTATARLDAELAGLGSLVVATGRARTREEVALAALEILCRATGADAGVLASIDGGDAAVAQRGLRQATVDAIVRDGHSSDPVIKALSEPGTYVSADIATAPLPERVRAAAVEDGIERLIVVALSVSDHLIGYLGLGWRERYPDEPSPTIMRQAAALIASSMENARLLGAVERGLEQERLLTRRMHALVELTRLPEVATAGGSGLERLMFDIGAVIGGDGSVHGHIEGDRLVLKAVDGIDWDVAEPLVNRPLASLPGTAELLSGAPAVLFSLGDGATTPEGAKASADQGFRSAAAFANRDDSGLADILFSFFRRPVEELEIDERTMAAIGRVLEISFANRRLREGIVASERRYRELFEGSPEALLVQSLDAIVVDANPAALRLYGDGVIGQPVVRLVADDLAAARGLPQSFDVTQYTGLGRRLDGTTFPAEVDLRPIEIAGEQRILAIVRDLTERSQMQAELIQAQKMEAIGMLVAGVAHELNNPLASIVAFSQLIRTDPGLPDDLRHQADLLVQEANRTRTIVKNLLDFARQQPPERTATDLRVLVESVLGLQSYIMSRNRLEVDVDLPADLPHLSVDRSQLQQVLINLTVNAAQAIQELKRPGRIVIAAREISNAGVRTVRISVADDGPGVDPAMVSRLFLPFATTKEPGAGTGLGLSVSFGIVAGHGGTLHHEANPGGGARFVIELPVGPPGPGALETAAEASGTARPAPARTIAPAASAGDRPSRILVLDDESSIRDVLGRVLKRAGYEPILAATGEEALELVVAEPLDAILCDHRMAGMDGTEFHAAVMAIAPHLRSRFVFMSGDVLNPELHEFAKTGGAQLLAKPFDITTIGTTIAELLSVEAR